MEQVLELLSSLKFSDLDSTLNTHSHSSEAAMERERVKKLKKRGASEIEFFQATAQYFQACETQVVANTPAGKSMPELLEKRRHDRVSC